MVCVVILDRVMLGGWPCVYRSSLMECSTEGWWGVNGGSGALD